MPWGHGHITEEVQITCPHWEPTIQLMEYEDGTRGLRFCFYHYGRFGRGPMMLREEDLPEMHKALEETPQIKDMLMRMLTGDVRAND